MMKPEILKNNIFENLIKIDTQQFVNFIKIKIEKDIDKQQLHSLIQQEEQEILKANHHGIYGKKTWESSKTLSFLYMNCAQQFLENDIYDQFEIYLKKSIGIIKGNIYWTKNYEFKALQLYYRTLKCQQFIKHGDIEQAIDIIYDYRLMIDQLKEFQETKSMLLSIQQAIGIISYYSNKYKIALFYFENCENLAIQIQQKQQIIWINYFQIKIMVKSKQNSTEYFKKLQKNLKNQDQEFREYFERKIKKFNQKIFKQDLQQEVKNKDIYCNIKNNAKSFLNLKSTTSTQQESLIHEPDLGQQFLLKLNRIKIKTNKKNNLTSKNSCQTSRQTQIKKDYSTMNSSRQKIIRNNFVKNQPYTLTTECDFSEKNSQQNLQIESEDLISSQVTQRKSLIHILNNELQKSQKSQKSQKQSNMNKSQKSTKIDKDNKKLIRSIKKIQIQQKNIKMLTKQNTQDLSSQIFTVQENQDITASAYCVKPKAQLNQKKDIKMDYWKKPLKDLAILHMKKSRQNKEQQLYESNDQKTIDQFMKEEEEYDVEKLRSKSSDQYQKKQKQRQRSEHKQQDIEIKFILEWPNLSLNELYKKESSVWNKHLCVSNIIQNPKLYKQIRKNVQKYKKNSEVIQELQQISDIFRKDATNQNIDSIALSMGTKMKDSNDMLKFQNYKFLSELKLIPIEVSSPVFIQLILQNINASINENFITFKLQLRCSKYCYYFQLQILFSEILIYNPLKKELKYLTIWPLLFKFILKWYVQQTGQTPHNIYKQFWKHQLFDIPEEFQFQLLPLDFQYIGKIKIILQQLMNYSYLVQKYNGKTIKFEFYFDKQWAVKYQEIIRHDFFQYRIISKNCKFLKYDFKKLKQNIKFSQQQQKRILLTLRHQLAKNNIIVQYIDKDIITKKYYKLVIEVYNQKNTAQEFEYNQQFFFFGQQILFIISIQDNTGLKQSFEIARLQDFFTNQELHYNFIYFICKGNFNHKFKQQFIMKSNNNIEIQDSTIVYKHHKINEHIDIYNYYQNQLNNLKQKSKKDGNIRKVEDYFFYIYKNKLQLLQFEEFNPQIDKKKDFKFNIHLKNKQDDNQQDISNDRGKVIYGKNFQSIQQNIYKKNINQQDFIIKIKDDKILIILLKKQQFQRSQNQIQDIVQKLQKIPSFKFQVFAIFQLLMKKSLFMGFRYSTYNPSEKKQLQPNNVKLSNHPNLIKFNLILNSSQMLNHFKLKKFHFIQIIHNYGKSIVSCYYYKYQDQIYVCMKFNKIKNHIRQLKIIFSNLDITFLNLNNQNDLISLFRKINNNIIFLRKFLYKCPYLNQDQILQRNFFHINNLTINQYSTKFLEKEPKESDILYQFNKRLNSHFCIFTVSKIIRFEIWRIQLYFPSSSRNYVCYRDQYENFKKVDICRRDGFIFFGETQMKEILHQSCVNLDYNDYYFQISLKAENQQYSFQFDFQSIEYSLMENYDFYIQYYSFNGIIKKAKKINLREIINLFIAEGLYKFQVQYIEIGQLYEFQSQLK